MDRTWLSGCESIISQQPGILSSRRKATIDGAEPDIAFALKADNAIDAGSGPEVG